MEIRYLNNSGFIMLNGEAALIIDCFDPARHTEAILAALSGAERVLVLASHAHADHFSRGILSFPFPCPAEYLLSCDIRALKHPHIAPGESVEAGGMRISAFGSTDAGVSFHIEWGGVSLFHAGDLNNWHWRDISTIEEAKEAEDAFLAILAKIAARVEKIDYAFFPVDPRMGTDYYRGAIQFCERLRPVALIPMHFGSRFAPPEAFFRELSATGVPLMTAGAGIA